MANIKTNRRNGTLLIEIVPSQDNPEEPAIKLTPGISIRIHGVNGGYLFSIISDENQNVTTFQDRLFYDGEEGQLAVMPYDWHTSNQIAVADLSH